MASSTDARSFLPALVILAACHVAQSDAALHPVYPPLLSQAGVAGFFQFRVPLDSAGLPLASQLQIISTPHAGFNHSVKLAVAAWHPRVAPGTRLLEHTILFLVLPAGSDSARACPRSPAFTVICSVAPTYEVRTLH
jgi:hypothetical protein